MEELLNDFLSFARQHKIPIWPPEKAKSKNPTLPDSPNFPSLPNQVEFAVNLMITLTNQANFLIDKLLISLNEKHMKEGGFNEQLYRKRIEYRNKNKS